jgi:hypothetical protein
VTAMPDRGYLVDHPIAGRDHWLAHPFELILAAWSIVFGTLLAISAFVPGFSPSPSLENLHPSLTLPIGLLYVAGGIGTHWSYWCTSIDLGTAWTVERLSLLLLVASWTAYALAVIAASPDRIVQWGNGLAIASACFWRWVTIGRRAKSLRSIQREMREGA